MERKHYTTIAFLLYLCRVFYSGAAAAAATLSIAATVEVKRYDAAILPLWIPQNLS